MKNLIEGQIVHYVLEDGQHRPAIVVQVWSPETAPSYPDGTVNLQVLLDGENDRGAIRAGEQRGMAWQTSVHYSKDREPGTWHWPVDELAEASSAEDEAGL